jgi:hypothetical protein
MNGRSLTSFALLLAPAIACLLLVQACVGSTSAIAQVGGTADPLEGVWESTITIRDCNSGTAIRTFKGVNVFHRGGTLSDTNSAAPTTRGPGAGIWRAGAVAGSYTASFRFYRYNPDGTLAGSQRVNRTFTLAASGNSTTGTIAAQVLDTAGTVLQSLCGTEASVRLY